MLLTRSQQAAPPSLLGAPTDSDSERSSSVALFAPQSSDMGVKDVAARGVDAPMRWGALGCVCEATRACEIPDVGIGFVRTTRVCVAGLDLTCGYSDRCVRVGMRAMRDACRIWVPSARDRLDVLIGRTSNSAHFTEATSPHWWAVAGSAGGRPAITTRHTTHHSLAKPRD